MNRTPNRNKIVPPSSLTPMLRTVTALVSLGTLAAVGVASATSVARVRSPVFFDDEFQGGSVSAEPFAMLDTPIGEPRAPAAASPDVLAGSAIAAFDRGILVVDEDSGTLVRLNKGESTVSATLDIGRGVSQVVVHPDGKRAFVADRRHDEIVVVDLDSGLARVDAFRTRAEPFGISLTPAGDTLLVTCVADQSVSAIDLNTGNETWTLATGPEPRGVTVAPDGREALVTFLTTGAVARLDLARAGTPRASFVSLDPGARASANNHFGSSGAAPVDPALTNEGRSFARNAFAAGYVGHGLAVVPHQLSTPHLASGDFQAESSGYGGGNGFTPPVSHRLAFLSTPEKGESGSVRVAMAGTNLHQPRALAYDGKTDTLYAAGFGNDTIMAISAVSQSAVQAGWSERLVDTDGACGPSGLAVIPDSGEVAIWCSLTRKVVWLDGALASTSVPPTSRRTDALTQSHLGASEQRGRELFRSGTNPVMSTFGAMACSSCHAEVRADGLSWRLQGKNLQTPFLAGRVANSHPFKWDGKDPTLQASLTNTVTRLGGSGITPEQAQDLSSFLMSVEAPRKPTADNRDAIARGQRLFDSDETGCATCHSGPLMTDQQSYDLSTDLGEVDTPSLVGLAHSAPYYHDGSAATLDALLRGNANVHGMGSIAKLTDAEIGDLVQYLKTL